MIQNGGVYADWMGQQVVRPTCARKIHVRAMSRLFHFLLVHARNEGAIPTPPDDPDWQPKWLSLLFSFVASIAIYKVTDGVGSRLDAEIDARITRPARAASARATAAGVDVAERYRRAAKPYARVLENKAIQWLRRVREDGRTEEMAHFVPSSPFREIHSNFGPIEMTVASIERGAIHLKALAAAMPPYARAKDDDACYDGVPAASRAGVDMRMEMRREAGVELRDGQRYW